MHEPVFGGLVHAHVDRKPHGLVCEDGFDRDLFHLFHLDIGKMHLVLAGDITGPLETIMRSDFLAGIIVEADEFV